jgi:D-alanyl-D-alanine carboxypeptidase/D-alanyl-D-alanine-endopeptidase (penicillin-binding protein 4)
MPKHVWWVISAIVVTSALLVGGAVPAGARANDEQGTGPSELLDDLTRIENKPKYEQSDWGYVVLDEKTGKVLVAQNDRKMFDPGSTMKTYSVSTALRMYGSDYEFHTPVYRQGTVAGDALDGNLVLVASGDLSLGLREQPDGTLFYENLPETDQSYADVPGLGNSVQPPGNPLAGLDELAAAVRAAGITQVNGDVVIDDRLFENYAGWPDGLISSMWVNENFIDVEVTPGDAGQPATIAYRPETAAYTVESTVQTVAKDAKDPTPLAITQTAPGQLVITGDITAGSKPTLQVYDVDDPSSFARTAFIEALQRAGVSVSATPTGPNPASLLPAEGSYQPGDMLGEHVSADLAQFANLILKVSYNRGADLMTCLAAAKSGSKDCLDGITEEVETITGLGIPKNGVVPQDGAGSDDEGRSTPLAMAEFYRKARSTDYGDALYHGVPVLGRSGTAANVLTKSPAAGKVHTKTGNRVVGNNAGQGIVLGNSFAGYINAKSGRKLTFMIAVGNVPIAAEEEFFDVVDDQARMIERIQQYY